MVLLTKYLTYVLYPRIITYLSVIVIMPVQDFPWGSRSGVMVDPYGYRWTIGNETGELPTPEKIGELMASWKSILPEN
jgi:hypothetical protein